MGHPLFDPSGGQANLLGVGTWAWGDRLLWGYGRGYNDADLEAAFRESTEAGLHLFDTAEIYGWGRSERLLGRFTRDHGEPMVVATKFFPYPWRLRRASLVRALRGSLRRLGREKVDLYQVHFPLRPLSIEAWMVGLAEAVEAGLTGAVGVSNYNADQMRRAHAALAKRGVPLASNQVAYNLLRRGLEHTGLLEACQELGVTLIAHTPLERGLLTGKYTPDHPPPGVRGLRYRRWRLQRLKPLIGLMREIGQAHGDRTPAQVAINWLICKGTLPIPGAKSAQQARENAGALGWRLAEAEIGALEQASEATEAPLPMA